jgi:hypothetical protein
MKMPIKFLLLAGVLSWVGFLVTSAAQTPETVPDTQAKPMDFDSSVRARERLAPTPQYALLKPGLFSRQIVQAAAARGDYTVQIWSLIVAPKTSTEETKLPGAAVLSVRAGQVEIITGDRRVRLAPGATTSVPEGASVRFTNSDKDKPSYLRAVVLSGSR